MCQEPPPMRTVCALIVALAVACLMPEAPGETPDQWVSVSEAMSNLDPVHCQSGGRWEWSEPAEHHRAIVQVRQGCFGGTGTVVELGGLVGVLTAQHVVDGRERVRITWLDGHTELAADGPVWDKTGADVAFVPLASKRPGWPALEFATRTPEPGERLEVCGLGGPAQLRLRHYWVTHSARTYRDSNGRESMAVAPDGRPMSGDSGGGVLLHQADGQVRLCSVVSAGDDMVGDRLEGWDVYQGLIYAPTPVVGGFVHRVCEARGGLLGGLVGGVIGSVVGGGGCSGGSCHGGAAAAIYPPACAPGVVVGVPGASVAVAPRCAPRVSPQVYCPNNPPAVPIADCGPSAEELARQIVAEEIAARFEQHRETHDAIEDRLTALETQMQALDGVAADVERLERVAVNLANQQETQAQAAAQARESILGRVVQISDELNTIEGRLGVLDDGLDDLETEVARLQSTPAVSSMPTVGAPLSFQPTRAFDVYLTR